MKNSVLCYIRKNNKTLFLNRNKKENDIHKNKWVGLGGKIHSGESPEDCLIREIREESGLLLSKYQLKGILTFPKFKNNEDWYVFLYEGYKFEGEIIECDEGELHWVDDNKINDLNLWDGDKLFFKWMKEDKFFSGKITYINKKLVNYEVKFY